MLEEVHNFKDGQVSQEHQRGNTLTLTDLQNLLPLIEV